jgi:hypothetical protein
VAGSTDYFTSLTDEELLRRLRPGYLEEAAFALACQEAMSRGLTVPIAPAESPRDDESADDGDFVSVARSLDPTEAHLLQAYLESCEIPAVVADANVVQAYQIISQALGGASVRVPGRYRAQAEELLKQFRQGGAELNEADLPDPVVKNVPEEQRGRDKVFCVYARSDQGVSIVVKRGFSWGAFLFGPLWFLVHGMWAYFLIAAVLYVGGHLFFQNSGSIQLLVASAIYLLTWFYIGKVANFLLCDALERRGYRLLATVSAKNSAYARDAARTETQQG